MENKKGFTIIELLVSFVILVLVGGIGMLSYNVVVEKSEKKYYESMESNLLLSGNEYFQNHRSELPIRGSVKVAIENLVDGGYMEELRDTKGDLCHEGDVYAYLNPNKTGYNYQVCLKCGSYETENDICVNDGEFGEISVKAYLGSNPENTYNTSLTYSNVKAINNRNYSTVNLEIDMVGNDDAKYFIFGKGELTCNNANRCDKVCHKGVSDSGSYKVIACNDNNEQVGYAKSVNVKIDKEDPTFKVDNSSLYTILDGTDKMQVVMTVYDLQDDYGIKKVEYCISQANSDCTTFKAVNNDYTIIETLTSDMYKVKVRVEDVSGKEVIVTKPFSVGYNAKLKRLDNSIINHIVVKGQKYGYIMGLPKKHNGVSIQWRKESEFIVVNDETIVTDAKEHMLLMIEQVTPLTNSACNDLTYNGMDQVLISAREGISFSNNTGRNAGDYTVTANLLYGLLWKYDDSSPKTITCNIKKKATTMSLSATSGTLTYGTNGAVTITTDGDGILSCTSSDTSVATCSISNKTLTITPVANTSDNKIATITVNQAAGTNYLATSKTYTATVNRLTLTCPSSPSAKTYNGNNQASGVACPSGSTASGETSGTNAGAYSQTCAAGSGYKFSSSCSVSWVISPKSLTCPSSPADKTYTGSAQASGITCPTNSIAGGDTSKTAAGTYAQTCVTNTNYTFGGLCSVSWKINPASLTCPSSPADKTYTGNPQGSGITCPTNSTAGGDTSKTAAGSYAQTCTAATNYTFNGTCSVSWKIKAASLTCPSSPADKTYTGSAQASGITCPTNSTAGGDTSKTAAGSYAQTCTAATNYTFNGTCSVSWKIKKAACQMTVTTPQSWGVTYSSSNAQKKKLTNVANAKGTVTWSIKSQKKGSTVVSYFTISGRELTMKKATPVGSYTVKVTAADAGNSNYNGCSKDITVNVTVSTGQQWWYDSKGGSGNQNSCLAGCSCVCDNGGVGYTCSEDGSDALASWACYDSSTEHPPDGKSGNQGGGYCWCYGYKG